MKKIYITESQLKQVLKLKETINQIVDVQPGETVQSALQKTKQEINRVIPGSEGKVNYVIPDKELKEDVEHGEDVVPQVVDYIINNYTDINCDSSISEVNNAIQDAYIECFGEEIEYDNKSLFREIINMLMDRLFSTVNESVAVFTKKQIKEAKRSKRIAESKVFTKADIVKNL